MTTPAPAALNVAPLNPPNKDLESMPFVDQDYLIKDSACAHNFLQSFKQLRANFIADQDPYAIWESNLPHYCLPAVNVFPEIIHLCAQNYDIQHRAVRSPSGSILFTITPDSINQMLNFKQRELLNPFSMDSLLEAGAKLSSEDMRKIARVFMLPDHQPTGPPPYTDVFFTEEGRLILDMIAFVLGYRSCEFVDETMLVILATFCPGHSPACKYNFAKFISNKIHDQLRNLSRQGVFKYSSYIYHLFMYYQSEAFPCHIKKLDATGERRSVIFWTAVYHRVDNSPYTYCEFIDQFVYPVSCLLMNSPPPRITQEMQRVLQLSKAFKIGDWYLYENHTVIRIYGCELCPFRLPRYVPMRLFALEYYRQLISSDLTHFHSAKKKAHLKFKNQQGPFIMNKKEGWVEAEKILQDEYKLTKSFRWVPYDPQGYISARRIKYRLLGCGHCKYPHIEQYANREEWEPDTLVEKLTEEELMNKAVKDLEKTLDLDSLYQVPFKPFQSAGEGTSTSATGPLPIAAAQDKGKAKMVDENEFPQGQFTDEQPEQLTQDKVQQNDQIQEDTAEQGQQENPPPQVGPPLAPVIQTPAAQEEKGRKRDREEVTPLSGSFQQPEAKRQRADSPEVEEISGNTSESQRVEGEASQYTGTSSFQQEQRRPLAIEEASSAQHTQKTKGPKASYKEIKAKNDILRVEVYKQFLNATPAQQERLMSVYDIEQEKMILSHYKPKIDQPKTAADFIRTRVEVMAKDIHPMDQIELHKQTGEMVYATLASKATAAHELKESLQNTNRQLDLERMSSTAKDNRIKSLEEIIIDLGHDPKDPKGVRALMKKKDDDLNAMRKRLKLLPTEHPQTAELQQEKQADEQLNLIMQLHQKVLDLEKELEGALQQPAQPSSQDPPATATNEATVVPAPTTELDQTAEAPANTSMEELTKAINDMELKAGELKVAKQKLADLDAKYDKSKMTVAEQAREIKALRERVKILEKELKLEAAIAEIKRILWARIDKAIVRQWKSIMTIHEQIDLIGQAKIELQKTKVTLGHKPEQANSLVNFLNRQTREELAAMNIVNRTEAVLTVKKVLTLRNYAQTLERKCYEIQGDIDEYKLKMGELQAKGLPSLLDGSGKLLPLEQYRNRMSNFAENQIIASGSASDESGPLSGAELLQRLDNLFFVDGEIHHLFEHPPDFFRHTEADETMVKIRRHQMPREDWWQSMVRILPR